MMMMEDTLCPGMDALDQDRSEVKKGRRVTSTPRKTMMSESVTGRFKREGNDGGVCEREECQ